MVIAIDGLSLGAIYALIALGYTMVYGIAKMLNFAHGDVIMVGAYRCQLPAAGYCTADLGRRAEIDLHPGSSGNRKSRNSCNQMEQYHHSCLWCYPDDRTDIVR